MIEKFKIKTISEKITLSIFIIIAICVLFSTLIVPRVIESQLEKKYEVEKAAATESLSYSLAPVLELYDYKQVERIITSSLAYENIARITVFNTGGILIVSASEQNVSSENLDIEEYEITSGDRVIGYFEISFIRKHIDEQITTTTLALVSGLVGYFLLAGLALFIFINRSVIKPIVLFTKTVRQMDSKNLSKRVNIKSDDELGTLAKSFNQMAENLRKSHTALEKAHDGLEVKVEQRTKQLKKALFKEKEALAILENSNWEIKNLRKQIDFILSAARTTLHIVDSDFNIIYVDPERQKIYGDSKGLKCYPPGLFNN